jgi:hypothetical protein
MMNRWTSFTNPFIDIARGGSIQGELDALNNLPDLAIAKHDEEGAAYIRSRARTFVRSLGMIEYRDMFTIIRDRVQAMIKQGYDTSPSESIQAQHGLRCPLRRSWANGPARKI